MGSKVRESRIKARIKHFLPFAVQKFLYGNIVKKARLLRIQLQGKITKEGIKKEDAEMLADELCKYDSDVWKLLAKAMEKELK